jgi:regulator of PEP synthase PpsR (kinase-PPPase family)
MIPGVSSKRAIYMISDSTGETGAKVVQAALLQFRHEHVRLRIFSNVRSLDRLAEIVDQAAAERALVVYTLVSADSRKLLHDRTARYDVRSIDLMGPLLQRISRWLGESPVSQPGLLHVLDDEYFARIEALEFTVKNDDGKLPQNFPDADVVLVGVSRTSKTPVATILAHKGLKCANQPLVLGVPPAPQLDTLDPRRVFALTIQPPMLLAIRQTRLQSMGVKEETSYSDMQQIQRELSWAREVVRSHEGWTTIDVTRKAIEETAAEIWRMYSERFGG